MIISCDIQNKASFLCLPLSTTGVFSSSIYHANPLEEDFPGETHRQNEGDVIVIKTHGGIKSLDKNRTEFSRVVLVVRRPIDSMKAEYTRENTGSQTGVLAKLNVTRKY